MNVSIKTFASVRDALGYDERTVSVRDGSSVAELLREVLGGAPGLMERAESLLVAVNEEYAAGDRIVRENDVVAIFPMVSGG
ncbi:MAG TPA: MoaD/ThiS family protein [Spirochaetota bacterium]|nr:MoaD/ThiS family protein [Spirochaetota bacterium]HNT11057.1 MoaD/ThiS family protein [Spirochaetota bacterium]HNV48424.1 MoaD/ThiS family protein [Spirochaetota bacterium]HOS39396.1 MoaD/ThiS family protein [Spirochaetota bacterium]HPU88550.1 MoaD/ThiS family protein [Spirochaetota bacterium]